jgi:hypothetical protein
MNKKVILKTWEHEEKGWFIKRFANLATRKGVIHKAWTKRTWKHERKGLIQKILRRERRGYSQNLATRKGVTHKTVCNERFSEPGNMNERGDSQNNLPWTNRWHGEGEAVEVIEKSCNVNDFSITTPYVLRHLLSSRIVHVRRRHWPLDHSSLI